MTESVITTLDDIVIVRQGYTFSQRFQGFSQGEWDYFKVADISNSGSHKYLNRANNRVDSSVLQLIGATPFAKGSIVFPRVGAALLNNNKRILAIDSVVDDNVLVLTVRSDDRCDNEYVYYWLCQQNLASFCNEGLVPVIASKNVRTRQIVIPALPEQRAIAAALSDTDAYIATLEKLIAKKKAIKQGAMQELLTGKRRLPGFGVKWVEKPLEQIMKIRKDRINPRDYENVRCIELEHIEPNDGRLIGWAESKNQLSMKAFFMSGDVLFGKLRPYLKKFFAPNFDGLCSTEFWVFTAYDDTVENAYIHYLVQTCQFLEAANSTTGTKMPRADWSLMKDLVVTMPSDIAEQTAIASILSDMKVEIEALTAKLNKMKLVKQGMMQELLTGRIRLVETEKKPLKIVSKEPTRLASTKSRFTTSDKPAARTHNEQFDDAVSLAAIVNAFYHPKYMLGRVKTYKLLYLMRRKQEADMAGFKEMAAGPYKSDARYNGGEDIAIKSKYIIETKAQGQDGFALSRGPSIDVALRYAQDWGYQPIIDWLLAWFRFYSRDKLETLATVDMAMCNLRYAGKSISLEAVKDVIRSIPKWRPKLSKPHFSDELIQHAIDEAATLF